MTDIVVGVVIEPPVGVANGLLDAARRLNADLGEKGVAPAWLPPEAWLAPLVRLGDGVEGRAEVAADAVRVGLMGVEEFGGQLETFRLLEGPGGAWTLACPVAVKEDEISRLVAGLMPRLDAAGLHPVAVEAPALALATVPESARGVVEEILATRRDAPLASWLVGGISVARGPAPADGALWCASRVRYLPLRRLGARREA